MATLPYRINSGLDRFSTVGVILLYHRVSEGVPDPQLLAVTPAHFAEHLEILAQACTPVRLHEAAATTEAGAASHGRLSRSPSTTATPTTCCRPSPCWSAAHVPATVFVASGHLGGTEFWWDELAGILLDTPLLPPVLTCRVGGVERTWTLGDAVGGVPGLERRAGRSGDRGEAYKELCALLGGLDGAGAGAGARPGGRLGGSGEEAPRRPSRPDAGRGGGTRRGRHGGDRRPHGDAPSAVRPAPARPVPRDAGGQDPPRVPPGPAGHQLLLSVRRATGLHPREHGHGEACRIPPGVRQLSRGGSIGSRRPSRCLGSS